MIDAISPLGPSMSMPLPHSTHAGSPDDSSLSPSGSDHSSPSTSLLADDGFSFHGGGGGDGGGGARGGPQGTANVHIKRRTSEDGDSLLGSSINMMNGASGEHPLSASAHGLGQSADSNQGWNGDGFGKGVWSGLERNGLADVAKLRGGDARRGDIDGDVLFEDVIQEGSCGPPSATTSPPLSSLPPSVFSNISVASLDDASAGPDDQHQRPDTSNFSSSTSSPMKHDATRSSTKSPYMTPENTSLQSSPRASGHEIGGGGGGSGSGSGTVSRGELANGHPSVLVHSDASGFSATAPATAASSGPELGLSSFRIVRPSPSSLGLGPGLVAGTIAPDGGVPVPPLQIHVHGVPVTGAKSRVETQIKMRIELVRPFASPGAAPTANDAAGSATGGWRNDGATTSAAVDGDSAMFEDGVRIKQSESGSDGEGSGLGNGRIWGSRGGHGANGFGAAQQKQNQSEAASAVLWERIGSWTHLKLPPMTATKRKSKKYIRTDVPPEKTLYVDATVVCATEPHSRVFTCAGCRQRERKRAQRKKDVRARPTKSEEGHGAASTGNELFGLGLEGATEEAIEDAERNRIVLFNCGDYVDFDQGEAILPTRITCYCRHHKEKLGFCIIFTMRDWQGQLVATGSTPPIMITDDHKSTQASVAAAAAAAQSGGSSTAKSPVAQSHSVRRVDGRRSRSTSIDRAVSGEEQAKTATMGSSAPGTGWKKERGKPYSAADREYKKKKGSSGLLLMTPFQTQPSSQAQSSPSSSTVNTSSSSASAPTSALGVPVSRGGPAPSLGFLSVSGLGQMLGIGGASVSSAADSPSALFIPSMDDVDMGGLAPPGSMSSPSILPPVSSTTSVSPGRLTQAPLSFGSADADALANFLRGVSPPPSVGLPPPTHAFGSATADSTTPSAFGGFDWSSLMGAGDASNLEIVPPPSSADSMMSASTSTGAGASEIPPMPKINRLIPGEGPTGGGIEVTVLGEHFVDGLTVVFGDALAVPTQLWGSNTLVCVLPPSPSPGPVVVSLRGTAVDAANAAPNTRRDGSTVQLFTYLDNADRALMELALQVVGMQMTGRIQDAKNVAMRIVGSDRAGSGSNAGGGGEGGGGATFGASVAGSQRRADGSDEAASSSASGARDSVAGLLAAGLGSGSTSSFQTIVIRFLSLLDVDLPSAVGRSRPSQRDILRLTNKQGHTLLHLATMLGFHLLVASLLARGASPDVRDRSGFTALHFAALLGRVTITRLLLQVGANDAARTTAGATPLEIARARDQVDVAMLLANTPFGRATVRAGIQADSGISGLSLSSEESGDLDDGIDGENPSSEESEGASVAFSSSDEKEEEVEAVAGEMGADESEEEEAGEVFSDSVEEVDAEPSSGVRSDDETVLDAVAVTDDSADGLAVVEEPPAHMSWVSKTLSSIGSPRMSAKARDLKSMSSGVGFPYEKMSGIGALSWDKVRQTSINFPRPTMPALADLPVVFQVGTPSFFMPRGPFGPQAPGDAKKRKKAPADVKAEEESGWSDGEWSKLAAWMNLYSGATTGGWWSPMARKSERAAAKQKAKEEEEPEESSERDRQGERQSVPMFSFDEDETDGERTGSVYEGSSLSGSSAAGPSTQLSHPSQMPSRAVVRAKLARRLGYEPSPGQLDEAMVNCAYHPVHQDRARRMQNDRMLCFFWIPMLVIALSVLTFSSSVLSLDDFAAFLPRFSKNPFGLDF